MNDRILIFNYYDIVKLPPVRSLIETLLNNNSTVTLVTLDSSGYCDNFKKAKLNVVVLKDSKGNVIDTGIEFITRKQRFKTLIEKLMRNHDILWTTTDRSVRELGDIVYRYKHVMQLMELVEDIPLVPGQRLMMTGLYKYAQKAYKVVVPEYNRAQITKTWWNLEKLPVVLPNKPAIVDENISSLPENVERVVEKIRKLDRKIIIYQGVIKKERPLEYIAQAVEKVKNQYAFCIMGEDKEGEAARLEELYECVHHIGFIAPPYHLAVTREANIGILSYIPSRDPRTHYSILNALYCAPNKIFEYAVFGIPMIGNDVPGIFYPLEMNKMGVVYHQNSAEDVLKAILKIEKDYSQYKSSALNYYASVDLNEIVCNQILEQNNIRGEH